MKYFSPKIFFLIILLTLFANCAYYNTFFNAKKYFNDAEKERNKRLEQIRKREQTSKTTRQSNLDKPSSGELKNYDQSIEKASKVLEIYPKSRYVDDALFLLGKCFYRKEDYNKAQRKFLELIQNFPRSDFVPESKLWLGKTNIELQDYETAEKNFHDILNSKSKDEIRDEAQFLLGGLFKRKKDFITAIDEYTKATQRTKDKSIRANAYYEMGDSYYQLKNFASAVESFRQARKYSPDSKFEFNAMLRAGLALKEMNNYDDAIKIFTNLLGDIVNEDNWPLCRLEIAHCNRLKGENSHAIEWYLDLITQHPKTEEAAIAYYYLGKMYQEIDGNYEQAKEYYDKSALEYPNAEIVADARLKSKSIQQLLTLRANIEAQRKRLAQGDSIAAELENLDLKNNELPEFELSNLDTLVATSLYIPLDSLMVSQDTLLSLYQKYYAKHYNRFGEKIQILQTPVFEKKPQIAFTLLDTLVATALKIPLNYMEDNVDSLYHVYDRYYANYKKNKVIYDQFYQNKNALGKNNQLGTPLEELVKSKLALAEIYLFEFSQPDSALKEYIDILEADTSSKVIPKTLFSIGYICETFKNDTLLADSVYQRLIARFPDDPLARQARTKIKSINIIDPEAEIANKYRSAEKAYIDKQQYDNAIQTFESIYKDAPSSEYAPKALLAMGWIYENDIQEYDKAFEIYQNLINDYPSSIYAKQVKPKVDEVIKARSSSTKEKEAGDEELESAKLEKKTTADSTQIAEVSLIDKEQYRRHLRQEMDKNDPRRKSPRRW
jgi:TolA-binding protein